MADDKHPGYMYVESARSDNRVALHEVDEAHPGGSVIVSRNSGPRKVAKTPFAMMRLRENELREVTKSGAKKIAEMHAKRAVEENPEPDTVPDEPEYLPAGTELTEEEEAGLNNDGSDPKDEKKD